MFTVIADIGLFAIKKIIDLWKNDKEGVVAKGMDIAKSTAASSLIDYTRSSRVEPIVLIDADCLYLDSLPEIQQSLLSIFAGYYLQAVAISTTVGKVSVDRQLDKLNPSRNVGNAAASAMGWLLTQEAYKHSLPTYEKKLALEAFGGDEDKHQLNLDKFVFDKEKFSHQEANDAFDHLTDVERDEFAANKFLFDQMKYYSDHEMKEKEFNEKVSEAQRQYDFNVNKLGKDEAFRRAQQTLQTAGLVLQERSRQDNLGRSEFGVGKDTFSTIKELTNLSVGKMFSVEITDGFHKKSIPISIRLMASSLPTASLIHILSIGSKDNSYKERYHAWKAGRLEFVKDLCFCQDLIDEYRKNLMHDKDGIYTNLMKRAGGNKLSTILSGNPSIATASNLVIMSNTTAAQLELHLNGKLSDFKTREKMFKETYIMIMVVVDKSWERATFYHRGISLPTEVGIRDMKAANKGSGPDVGDILAAYRMGNSPSL